MGSHNVLGHPAEAPAEPGEERPVEIPFSSREYLLERPSIVTGNSVTGNSVTPLRFQPRISARAPQYFLSGGGSLLSSIHADARYIDGVVVSKAASSSAATTKTTTTTRTTATKRTRTATCCTPTMG